MAEAALAGDRAETAQGRPRAEVDEPQHRRPRGRRDGRAHRGGGARPRRRPAPRSKPCTRRLLATLDVLDGYPRRRTGRPSGRAAPPTEQERLLAGPAPGARAAASSALVYQPQFDRDGEAIARRRGAAALDPPDARRRSARRSSSRWPSSNGLIRRHHQLGARPGHAPKPSDLERPLRRLQRLGRGVRRPRLRRRAGGADRARHGFDPRRLEIEITETAILAEERRGAPQHGPAARARA